MQENKEFYSAKEAAKKLGLKYHTFLARAHSGQYPFVKVGWAIMFKCEEINKHVDDKALGETTR